MLWHIQADAIISAIWRSALWHRTFATTEHRYSRSNTVLAEALLAAVLRIKILAASRAKWYRERTGSAIIDSPVTP